MAIDRKEDFPLKGFCYPLTPGGRSSVIGSFPWHYGTEYLNILYRTDPEVLAAYLPHPLEPGPEPDMAYVAFSRWWSLSEEQKDMAWVNPGRTQYREAAIWVGCSYKGKPGQICLHVWVDDDFTLARGWFMGFPKKLGRIQVSEFHPLNPGMPEIGPGVAMKGIAAANDERLFEGSLKIERKVTARQLPTLMTSPLFHIRHFPSIVKGAPPSVLELVTLGAENKKTGDTVWAGSGDLVFYPSEIEEHFRLKPREITGAYAFSSGYTFPGGEVLYSWV